MHNILFIDAIKLKIITSKCGKLQDFWKNKFSFKFEETFSSVFGIKPLSKELDLKVWNSGIFITILFLLIEYIGYPENNHISLT